MPERHSHRPATDDSALLKVENLEIHFPIRKGILQRVRGYTRAVNGVSFSINKGETLALVGESGCGKTTTGRAILNLEKATGGEIWYQGQRIDDYSRRDMQQPLRKKIQVIFQSPYSSMNPRITVGGIIEEGMISLNIGHSKEDRMQRIEMLCQPFTEQQPQGQP